MKIHSFSPELELTCTFRGRYFVLERDSIEENWGIDVTAECGMKDYDGYFRDSADKTLKEAFIEACHGSCIEPPKKWPKKLDEKNQNKEIVDFCINCGGYRTFNFNSEICQDCEENA